MIILGIETSCDDTAVSLIRGTKNKLTILSHIVSSQIMTHRKYGGVVPEVAARRHVINIIPTLDSALRQAKISSDKIDVIAVTRGPGLVTSLRVGVQTAKALAFVWRKKIIGVNHMEGHIYANWLGHHKISLPALCLIVSGGHTELILMKNHGQYKLVGQTRDDAAGEAFDKVAKLIGLKYPGGPLIQKLAKQGNANRFNFPRPMLYQKNYDFSFSGLKTAVLYLVKEKFSEKKLPLADICASFQQAVVDVLVKKTIRAAKKLNVKTIILAGGVAANEPLRQQLASAVNNELELTKYISPPLDLCTDNASMIAMAGFFHAIKKDYSDWHQLEADPNWELA